MKAKPGLTLEQIDELCQHYGCGYTIYSSGRKDMFCHYENYEKTAHIIKNPDNLKVMYNWMEANDDAQTV